MLRIKDVSDKFKEVVPDLKKYLDWNQRRSLKETTAWLENYEKNSEVISVTFNKACFSIAKL